MPSDGEGALRGAVALVTGGARGIGLAITRRLHARGARVVVADSGVSIAGENPDPTVAERVVAELGAGTAAFTQDLAEPASARAAVESAASRFGAIDIVVNNAAILRDAFIFKGNSANWDAVIRTNLSAAFYVLSAATPLMREQAKAGRTNGRIINITSSAGLYGNFGQSPYAAAKAGLVGLTRVVAMDMARSGVTCNAVAPFAATRVTEIIQPATQAQAQYKARALKIAPSFVADFVAVLCSAAAQSISGQLFGVRGREIFLYSQPRPVDKIVAPQGEWREADFIDALKERFGSKFTELSTDLEAFNTEPIV